MKKESIKGLTTALTHATLVNYNCKFSFMLFVVRSFPCISVQVKTTAVNALNGTLVREMLFHGSWLLTWGLIIYYIKKGHWKALSWAQPKKFCHCLLDYGKSKNSLMASTSQFCTAWMKLTFHWMTLLSISKLSITEAFLTLAMPYTTTRNTSLRIRRTIDQARISLDPSPTSYLIWLENFLQPLLIFFHRPTPIRQSSQWTPSVLHLSGVRADLILSCPDWKFGYPGRVLIPLSRNRKPDPDICPRPRLILNPIDWYWAIPSICFLNITCRLFKKIKT